MFHRRIDHIVDVGASVVDDVIAQAHNERVVRVVPPAQLLVMDFAKGDGYPQLCAFLGPHHITRRVLPLPHMLMP